MSSTVSSTNREIYEQALSGDNPGYDYLELDPTTMTSRREPDNATKTLTQRIDGKDSSNQVVSDKIMQLVETNVLLKTKIASLKTKNSVLFFVIVVYGIFLLVLGLAVTGVIGGYKEHKVDRIPPTIICPPDQTVSPACNTRGTYHVTLQPCTATDDSGTVNLVSQSHQSGQYFLAGPTEVTFTFTDDTGNRASGSYTVNVVEVDDTPPVCRQINDVRKTLSLGSGSDGTDIIWTEPTATDACSQVTLVSRSHAPGDRFLAGTTHVSYIFSDASNNRVTCSFSIDVTEGHFTSTLGAVYVRWGRTTCPPVSEITYAGLAGGKWYSHSGSGSNYLCLPEEPEYDVYQAGVSDFRAYVYSAEYQIDDVFPPYAGKFNHDVPCAVCRTTNRGSMMMIPAKMTCPSGWTKEYNGYLMSEKHTHHSTEFVCVDRNLEVVPGGVADDNGALLYPVEGRCNIGNLPCTPYINGAELPCVVCSK